jgi:hypothetical protein
VKYNSGFYGFFAQDDWQVSSRAQLLYGLRYDIFDVPRRDRWPESYSQASRSTETISVHAPVCSWSVDQRSRTVVPCVNRFDV